MASSMVAKAVAKAAHQPDVGAKRTGRGSVAAYLGDTSLGAKEIPQIGTRLQSLYCSHSFLQPALLA